MLKDVIAEDDQYGYDLATLHQETWNESWHRIPCLYCGD
jgi:hypothetical protein